jgi:hypothetical protein
VSARLKISRGLNKESLDILRVWIAILKSWGMLSSICRQNTPVVTLFRKDDFLECAAVIGRVDTIRTLEETVWGVKSWGVK